MVPPSGLAFCSLPPPRSLFLIVSIPSRNYSLKLPSSSLPSNFSHLSLFLQICYSEMDKTIKQLLKRIEEDRKYIAKQARIYCQNKPEMIAKVEDFYVMCQSLAEHSDYLTKELQESIGSALQTHYIQNAELGFDQDSTLQTPNYKQVMCKSIDAGVTLSSDGDSSTFYLKEGIESSPSSSSDSDSESFLSANNNLSISWNSGGGLRKKIFEFQADIPSIKQKLQGVTEENLDSKIVVGENDNYEALVEKITKLEKELKISNIKLQLSEDEVNQLKSDLKGRETAIVLAGDLQSWLESVHNDVEMKETDFDLLKRQGMELQRKLAELEALLSNSNFNNGTLMKELQGSKERLKKSDQDLADLKHELQCTHQAQSKLDLALEDFVTLKDELEAERKQNSELKERFASVNDALREESIQLQSEISIMKEQQNLLEARLNEWELKVNFLEDKLRQCEAEKVEMKILHDAQETELQGQIIQMKAAFAERGGRVEALNKELDKLTFKYDMLIAEKDEVTAKANTLTANIGSQKNCIRQMQERQRQFDGDHLELITGYESAQKQVVELKARVEELEQELDRQKVMISDRAEEKREAIRQLCFSLEHFRTRYKELCQAYKGHAVIAS